MVSYRDYVAGWLDSSIHDFLQTLLPDAAGAKYALITCLDSNRELKSLLNRSPELAFVAVEARPLGNGLLLPTSLLLPTNSPNQVFFGFDEIWFFPSERIKPKPDNASVGSPPRIDQKKLTSIGEWMADNSCSLALGDGVGLNFIIEARGLAKYMLGHSIQQPESTCSHVTVRPEAVAE